MSVIDEQEEQRLHTTLRQTPDGVPVLDLRGEVDLSTAPILKEALTHATENSRHLIINMADVTYMDSSGFGTLLAVTRALRPLGGSVHLVGCNSGIDRMLQITRLNTLFGIHGSEDEARLAIPAATSA